MKHFYIILLLVSSFVFKGYAQPSYAPTNPQETYLQSTEVKEDFWSKFKRKFHRKKNKSVVRTDEPVLVANDPNRTVRRVSKSTFKPEKEQREIDLVENKDEQKKDKTFSQRWNTLVNGKNYVPQKNYNRRKRNQYKEPIVLEKNKKTINQTANPQQLNATKNTPTKNTKGTSINRNTSTASTGTPNKTIAPTRSNPLQSNSKKNVIPKINPAQNTKSIDTISSTPISSEVKDIAIRNEIQPLSLTQSASGTAAYFFSGVRSGKFYVVTNLANKGKVVKVTNMQNGKSLMAEVMDALPSNDVRRGVLIKISDNAKLPLGQNNNSFTVKVNY